MTRKHFEAIAEILARNEASESMIENMVEFFKKENAKFDSVRFRNYVYKMKR